MRGLAPQRDERSLVRGRAPPSLHGSGLVRSVRLTACLNRLCLTVRLSVCLSVRLFVRLSPSLHGPDVFGEGADENSGVERGRVAEEVVGAEPPPRALGLLPSLA